MRNWITVLGVAAALGAASTQPAVAIAAPQAAQAPALGSSIQSALNQAETAGAKLAFDPARDTAFQAMQNVIVASGEQPIAVRNALATVTARTKAGQVALDMLRARVETIVADCTPRNQPPKAVVKAKDEKNPKLAVTNEQPVTSCEGLSVTSIGGQGGSSGLFGGGGGVAGLAPPPPGSGGGADYSPTP